MEIAFLAQTMGSYCETGSNNSGSSALIPELRYAVDAGFALSFRTGNAKDLAEKINLLLQRHELRQNMGLKAREYAQNYSWDRIAGEYEMFLAGIVNR